MSKETTFTLLYLQFLLKLRELYCSGIRMENNSHFLHLGVEDITHTLARKLQFLSSDNLNKFHRL